MAMALSPSPAQLLRRASRSVRRLMTMASAMRVGSSARMTAPAASAAMPPPPLASAIPTVALLSAGGLTFLNPVDLGRVLPLLQLDTAALMGYTGAVFERFFGGALGEAVTTMALLFWCVGPLLLAHRVFRRKDF